MIRVVLFDFDGTVYDTVEGITRSVRHALLHFGLDVPAEELRCFAGPPLADMFAEKYGFGPEQSAEAVRLFRERYLPVGVYESRAFPEVRPMVEHLRAAGLKVGIATSKPERLAKQLLEGEDMLGLFDVVAGSADIGNNNAKWQVIERAMAALGAAKVETVLVGDTKYDAAGAARVGIPCIGVSYGYAAPGELEAAGVTAVVPDCASLEKLLLEMA